MPGKSDRIHEEEGINSKNKVETQRLRLKFRIQNSKFKEKRTKGRSAASEIQNSEFRIQRTNKDSAIKQFNNQTVKRQHLNNSTHQQKLVSLRREKSINIMKRLLTLLLLICTIGASAQNIECDFTQSKFIKASGKTFESKGSLKLVATADKMEMNYTQPAGDYFIIDGKTVKINLKGRKSVIDTEKNAPMRTQRNILMNCITGKWQKAATDNNAETAVTEKGSSKIVTLSAKQTAPRGYSKITVTYRKSDNVPTELVLEEFNGTKTTYKMSNIIKK